VIGRNNRRYNEALQERITARGQAASGSKTGGGRQGQSSGKPDVGKELFFAQSNNAKSALSAKLSGLQSAQKSAVIVRNLPDGRIRYYRQETLARSIGPTRGARFVTEYNPRTGSVRQWMENYDHLGNVVRVHPKSINGQVVNGQHYPPTGTEIRQGIK
jgi:identified by metaGeneAnnotator